VKPLTGKVCFEAPTWNHIYRLLLQQSRAICRSGFQPDLLVGVSRGGWVSARILSDLLENANLVNVKVECYLGIGEALVAPRLTQCLSADVAGKRVLIVDEVADSGKSLQLVVGHVREKGAQQIKTAVLYLKPCCSFKPDFWAATTACWLVFPWEIKETLRKIMQAHKTDASQAEAELAELVRAGVSKSLIARFLREFSEAKSC
jgi:hypoxanthine phosphoribosyltransferase